MSSHVPFKNLFITPVLPFGPDGAPDWEDYRRLLRVFLTPANIEAGVAIIANPEAGELYTLDREERNEVVRVVLDEVAGRTPVLAGVVHVTTAGYVECAADAAELGVDGLFVFPPIGAGDITLAWNPDAYPEVFIDILKAIAAEVDLPQVLHPVGRVTQQFGPGLGAGITRRIIEEVPQVVGWKMTYNYDGYRAITRVIRAADREVGIYSALAVYMHENLADGAFDGTSSGAFNYAIEPMIQHIEAWRAGDVVRATEIWHSGLSALHEYIFADYGRLHIRYKVATWLRGFIENPLMRAPMPRPHKFEIREIRRLLADTGLSVRSDAEIAEALARNITAG
ncbi:dihydrodipicolinate synthase family protein [Nocardia sienata]|uniref:dihydrodipicolinate synthase family protein n=1 Tax=Nocardia sienata TaxID=248552 RepID=UPI0007A49C46|nr:dihydrodipicolinate synthase family protein [Nocardia sienata]